MAVRSAKNLIHEVRIRANMTQEQMSEGICSLQALSRIEHGTLNASSETFHALTERANFPRTTFPTFASRIDFECYRSLKYARVHLDAWQLTPAYNELNKLKSIAWADNKLYYQEWLLLHSRLQFRSYRCDHRKNYKTLLTALQLTRSHPVSLPLGTLLTRTETEILITLSQESLYLGNIEECFKTVTIVEKYLSDSHFTAVEKARLQAENAIVHTKYLLAKGSYSEALEIADYHRHQMVSDIDTAPLFELTFLTGLCYFYLGHTDKASKHIRATLYAAYAVKCCYVSVCLNYLQRKIPLFDSIKTPHFLWIPLKKYPTENPQKSPYFFNETYSLNKTHDYTLGDIIRDFRMEQHLSQTCLCNGLCSKSKLSKIENKILQPDIALAEALLQRLGISEQIFTFWGNEKETKFYDLKSKSLYAHLTNQQETSFEYIEEMETLTKGNDILWKQECLAAKVIECTSSLEKVTLLTKALHCTIPDFDIHRLLSYRLTWQELNILNNIAHEYRNSSESCLSSLYFLQLLEYQRQIPLDIQLRTSIFSVTNYMYCHSLYDTKNFKEIAVLFKQTDLSVMRYSISTYCFYLFCHSQIPIERNQYDYAVTTMTLAHNLSCFLELYENVLS